LCLQPRCADEDGAQPSRRVRRGSANGGGGGGAGDEGGDDDDEQGDGEAEDLAEDGKMRFKGEERWHVRGCAVGEGEGQ
jgi:hypothetical protein